MLTLKDINNQNEKVMGHILIVTTVINIQICRGFDRLKERTILQNRQKFNTVGENSTFDFLRR